MSFRKGYNKFRLYWGFLILVFYLVVGILFLFTDTWADLLPKSRFAIGIILILFGILRCYIGYRLYTGKAERIRQKEEKNKNAATE